MKRLSIFCLFLALMFAGDAWAKRVEPKPVTPVVHNGVKYSASNDSGVEAKVEARNEKTGDKLWDVVIYTVKIKPDLEEDVQWVFITQLAVRDNSLLVTNEKNQQFTVDLTTKKVPEVKREKGKPQ
jgi:hypothetical protein